MAAIPVTIDVTVNNVKEVPYKDDKGRDALAYRLMCNFDEYTFAEIRCNEEIAKAVVGKHRYILSGTVEPNPTRNGEPRPLRIDRIVEDRGYSFAGLDEEYLRAMQQHFGFSFPAGQISPDMAAGSEAPAAALTGGAPVPEAAETGEASNGGRRTGKK